MNCTYIYASGFFFFFFFFFFFGPHISHQHFLEILKLNLFVYQHRVQIVVLLIVNMGVRKYILFRLIFKSSLCVLIICFFYFYFIFLIQWFLGRRFLLVNCHSAWNHSKLLAIIKSFYIMLLSTNLPSKPTLHSRTFNRSMAYISF